MWIPVCNAPRAAPDDPYGSAGWWYDGGSLEAVWGAEVSPIPQLWNCGNIGARASAIDICAVSGNGRRLSGVAPLVLWMAVDSLGVGGGIVDGVTTVDPIGAGADGRVATDTDCDVTAAGGRFRKDGISCWYWIGLVVSRELDVCHGRGTDDEDEVVLAAVAADGALMVWVERGRGDAWRLCDEAPGGKVNGGIVNGRVANG